MRAAQFGLAYSDNRYVEKISIDARCYGDLLGPDVPENPDAEREPSIMVHEHNGRLRIAIVPIGTELPFGTWTKRERSVLRARALLSGDRDIDEGEPVPIVLADIPLWEIIELECKPEGAIGWSDGGRYWDKLLEVNGLAFEKRDDNDYLVGPRAATLENDFISFTYGSVTRPWWYRSC